jgi:hypothetical protein
VKATLLSCALLLALTNCASSGEADLDGGETDAAIKTDAAKVDSGKQDSSQGQQCVSQCATDDDCANSCPQVPNGVNCCDTSTGICYAYSSTVCPAPVGDAGFD